MRITNFAADAFMLNNVRNYAFTVDNSTFCFTFASLDDFLRIIQLVQVVLLFLQVSFELSKEWVVIQNP